MTTILEVTGLEGGYGSVQILNGIDLYVKQGEFVKDVFPGKAVRRPVQLP